MVADVAQLEPRVLAGMSGDHGLARSARGADLYQGMVDDGAVATRTDAKLGLLGAMYGATSGESGRMVAGLTRRYPAAFGLVEEAARAGERGQVVRTLLGRGSPSLGDGVGVRPGPAAGRSGEPGPPATRVRALHPQLRRPGDRCGVGAVLDRGPAQPAVAARQPGRSRSARTSSSSSMTRWSCTRRPTSRTTWSRPGARRRDGRGTALPRPRDRLPAQHLGREVLRRRREAGSCGRRRWLRRSRSDRSEVTGSPGTPRGGRRSRRAGSPAPGARRTSR